MELNWTTFTLEIINFLVLVWILKRFLYHPVMDVIERRRARVERTLEDAHTLKQEAEDLRAEYENRLSDWDKEKLSARDELRKELQTERKQRLAQLDAEIDKEREKAAVLQTREQEDRERELQLLALGQAARFSARLLERIRSPELQARLVTMLDEDMRQWPESQRDDLRAALADGEAEIEVFSAYPLDAAQRSRIRDAIAHLAPDASNHWAFHEDDTLLAGVRVTVGPWVLGANLRDELQLFTESHHGGT